jgi:hypothetical protein
VLTGAKGKKKVALPENWKNNQINQKKKICQKIYNQYIATT